MVSGLDIYSNKVQCGVCHVLQAAGSTGTIGPNLDQLKPQRCLETIATVTIWYWSYASLGRYFNATMKLKLSLITSLIAQINN